MTITLLHGDCLVRMAEIPDGSVDMILADLPYGTTACKWDNIIPFEPLWEHYWRVLKPNGAVVLFGSEPFSSHLRMSQIKHYRYDWVWVKNRPTGFTNAKLMPLKSTETITVFSKAKTANGANNMVYYPQDLIRVNKISRSPSKPKNENSYSRPSHSETFIQEYMNYPTNVLSFKKDDKERIHPTQKPVALLEYLIKTYTLEGETVLDNTMGSGSTGVACVNTNRKFIGIEQDDKYFAIAQKRIADALNTLGEK